MSHSYASRLKEYPNKGVCGLPELKETDRTLTRKKKQLVDWIKAADHLVVLTGAGVSTSAGIPDFRGPRGVWTREQQQEQQSSSAANGRKRNREPAAAMDFAAAQPTLTHRAITKLVSDGVVKYCITQNVDGLHRRSGLPRSSHSVLHGCVFTEKCEDCHTEHFRDFACDGISFQKTGRKCERCGGDLRDTLLDWEDELPEDDNERALHECEKADLVLCLGTSLRIEPAGSLPLLAKKFVIVNLQETPHDREAAMIIRGRVDEVLESVMEQLDYEDWDKDDSPPIERLWRYKDGENATNDGDT